MKITYHQNPLHTTVELDEFEKREFWYKLMINELRDLVQGAAFNLQEGEYFDLAEARKEVDTKYLYDETGNSKGKSGIDQRVDELQKSFLGELQGQHCGDCICFPCTCSKCWAESILGIDTIPGLHKHEASHLLGAFGKENERTIHDAIEYLRNREWQEPEDWKKKHPGLWASALPRWKQENEAALQWLEEYRDEHFPVTVPA